MLPATNTAASVRSQDVSDEARDSLSLAELEHRITELAANLYAGTYRWLCLLREFDERGGCTAGASTPARTG